MEKIPTIFIRNPEKMSEVTDIVNQECQWVFDGEGVAKQKLDGTCVMIKDGKYYKRHTIKNGKKEFEGFILCTHDKNTGKKVGWILVDPDHSSNKYHMDAFRSYIAFRNGTYELIGPKFQLNPENVKEHLLIKHSDTKKYDNVPRTYTGIKKFLENLNIEGLVFHHSDGRMGKIKKKDFGLKRN